MNTTRGIAPIFVILIVAAVLGGGTLAIVQRDTLKSFFEKGDKPTQEQFSTTIDSNLNLQDDRDFIGLKEYNPAKDYLPGDTAIYNKTTPGAEADAGNGENLSVGAGQQPQPAPTPQGCVSNVAPVFTRHITDLAQVDSIVPPPTMGAGPSLKTHSYINSDHARVPLYAPADLIIKAGSHYTFGPYMLDFWASCEVTVRFGHVTEPIESIKKLLPAEPKEDSRTQGLSGLSFKAGELIGFTTGTSAAGNWDFGVYNSTVKNRYANDPDYDWSETYTAAVCPFEYFTPELKAEYQAKYNANALGGNPPDGESFCN